MDSAYSLDIHDIVDPERAYELFRANIIVSKQNFECRDDNCSAQLTCVNIDKLRRDMKQSLHFRVIGAHADNCRYATIKGSVLQEINSNSRENPYRNKHISNFHFQRPPNYFDKKDLKDEISPDAKKNHKKKLNENVSNNENPNNYYCVRSFVTKYINCPNLDEYFVRIKGIDISYSDFFVDINKMRFEDINNYSRIYYQKISFIGRVKRGNIMIGFEKGFKNQIGNLIKTSLFIDKSIYPNEEYTYWESKLQNTEELIENEIIVYVYGKPFRNKEYINFKIDNLDFLDIRTQSVDKKRT